ncbi:MAG: PAS domain-containing protein [Alphaproteobacteria bacterium]|jgi:PAS domain S-box-containing protein|nr:PAS domain-containing protein [Alphaproteobacteria bacterium]
MLLTLDQAYSRLTEADYTRAALITDPHRPDNPIIYATRAFYDLTGYSRDEVVGRNCRFLQGPDTDPQAVRHIREAIHALRPITIDILNYSKDGRPFWNRLRIRPSFDAQGDLESFIGVQNPIPEEDVRPFKLDHFVE